MKVRATLLRRSFAVCLCVACVLATSDVQAQPGERSIDDAGRPFFGLWLGGESVSSGVDHTCARVSGRSTMGLLGGFLVIPLGPIGIEGTVGRHARSDVICAEPGHLIQPGTQTSRSPLLPGGGFTSLDLRIRWTPQHDATWFFSAGAGWAGSVKDIPYFITSVGARSRTRSIFLGVNLDVALYHVPWTETTVQIAMDGTATQLARRELKEWSPAVGVRFSIEIPVVS